MIQGGIFYTWFNVQILQFSQISPRRLLSQTASLPLAFVCAFGAVPEEKQWGVSDID